MDCFPACTPCTGLCQQPVRGVQASRHRIEWEDRLKGCTLTCGHPVELPPAVMLFSKDVMCFRCGVWRKIKPDKKKKVTVNPNQAVIDYDEPPF